MQKKAKKRKIKNCILIGFTAFAVTMAIISACALDSDSWIPAIVFAGCMLWISLFIHANDGFHGDDDLEEGEF